MNVINLKFNIKEEFIELQVSAKNQSNCCSRSDAFSFSKYLKGSTGHVLGLASVNK